MNAETPHDALAKAEEETNERGLRGREGEG
jgi:hypothetical protein